MRVILGADPLSRRPLTGIGNYTLHLARNLLALDAVKDLRLASHTGFVAPSTGVLETSDEQIEIEAQTPLTTRLSLGVRFRSRMIEWLATQQFAINAYQTLRRPWQKSFLAPFADTHVYHSPNYLLPEFNGRRVVTVHDLSVIRFPEFHPAARVSLIEDMIARVVSSDARIVCDSELVAAEIKKEFSVDPCRLTTVPLGVDTCFQPRTGDSSLMLDKLGLQPHGFFLVVGTIEPRKNIRRICLAYRRFREMVQTGIPMVFVGDEGWRSSREHDEIADLQGRGWARYLRYVPNHELVALYQNAAALVFPSLYEGFGLPAAEAQACGCRVISSQHSAMSEFLSSEDIQVDPHSVEQIAEAMCQALDMLTTPDAAVGLLRPVRRWNDVALDMLDVYSA